MIGGDEQGAAGGLHGCLDGTKAAIHRLAGGDGGGQAAGMAHHIGIGEVQHDQIMRAGGDGGHRLFSQLRRAHFRLQVIGRHFGGGHHDARLAGQHCLLAAIEEVGDVGVFFGLGHAQLGHAGAGDDLAQQLIHGLRREERGEKWLQCGGILRHAHCRGEARRGGAGEAGEARVEQGCEDFSHPIGAEIEAEQPIAIGHAGVVANDGCRDEFIGLAGGMGGDDGRLGAFRRLALAQHHGVPGLADALPPIVSIHGEVAAAKGGEPRTGRQCCLEIGHEARGGLRRGVAPIGPAMNGHGHAGTGENSRQGYSVVLVRMHAAGREQAHEMQRAAAGLQCRHRRRQGRVACQ